MPNDLFLQQCRQETAALHALLSLLEEEQRAIVRFDALKLDACAVSKQQQLQLLQDSKAQRLSLLAEHQLDGRTAFQQWLFSAEPALQQAWMALEHELAKVQALNDSNAAMAAERMTFATETLSALREEAKAIDGYGRDGNFAATQTASRRLGSA